MGTINILFIVSNVIIKKLLYRTLSMKASGTSESSKSDVFAIIFVLIWVGAFVVTLNA
jgi:hypothetical protein